MRSWSNSSGIIDVLPIKTSISGGSSHLNTHLYGISQQKSWIGHVQIHPDYTIFIPTCSINIPIIFHSERLYRDWTISTAASSSRFSLPADLDLESARQQGKWLRLKLGYDSFWFDLMGFNGIWTGYEWDKLTVCQLTIWLVVDLPLWKIMELKSVGIITFPRYGKIKFMFETTNQKMIGKQEANHIVSLSFILEWIWNNLPRWCFLGCGYIFFKWRFLKIVDPQVIMGLNTKMN